MFLAESFAEFVRLILAYVNLNGLTIVSEYYHF